MNFQFYLEKLFDSEEFQKFKEENKDAIPSSCFFVIDKEGNDNKQHFDYYIPSQKKMFSFKIEDNCAKVPVDIVDGNYDEKLAMNYSFDFNDIEKIIQSEMDKRQIKNKIQKILLSLQCKNGKDFLVGTVFISNMGLLKVNIDISKMEIIHFEKKSFLDMLKISGKKKEE